MERGKLRGLLADPAVPGLLRGEIWIEPQVLETEGFPQGPLGLVGFAEALGAEVCFFRWPDGAEGMGGRELATLAHSRGLGCALVVDGPFQRLASCKDPCALLAELAGDPKRFTARLDREKERVIEALDRLKGAEIDLVLIGEDVGYGGGLYFAPEIFRTLLLPFYAAILERLQADSFAWGWHSDGNVGALLPELVACGFRCFSLEPECIDLLDFKRRNRSRICLIGGIRAAWLTTASIDRALEEISLREIRTLVREGGLILASTCGLHNPAFLPNIKRLYRSVAIVPPCHLENAGQ